MRAGSSVSRSNVSCSPADLRSHSLLTGLPEMPRARSAISVPPLPNHAASCVRSTARSSAIVPDPPLVQGGLALRADARNPPDRERVEKRLDRFRSHDRQPVGLLEVRGDLGDELVRPDADRAGESLALDDLGLHRPRVDGRALEVAKGGEVEEGLVDARLLEGIGAPRGDGHDPVRHFTIDRTVTAKEHGLRLSAAPRRLRQAPRARDRHRRPDAVLPRRVACRGDDAPARARLRIGPDDDGAAAKIRVPALFHRGIEGVHVEMGDDPDRRGRVRRAHLAGCALGDP